MLGFSPLAAAPLADVGEVTHNLQVGEFTTGNVSIATTGLTQNHDLSGVYTPNAPPAPVLTMFEDESFSAPNVLTGTVRISPTVIVEVNGFSTADITTGAPTVATTEITQIHAPASNNVISGFPSVGLATITQVHDITTSNVTSAQ